jgi:aspartate/methionine/tyrosine aminotransferase
MERILRNRGSLEKKAGALGRIQVRPAQGGWYGLLELSGEEENDEELAVELLKKERVLVHPGGFYDLSGGKFFVISLLPPPNRFDEGIEKVIRFLKARTI